MADQQIISGNSAKFHSALNKLLDSVEGSLVWRKTYGQVRVKNYEPWAVVVVNRLTLPSGGLLVRPLIDVAVTVYIYIHIYRVFKKE
jgi:uncharacterized protein YqgC (DUF456 family)